jgi:hypothetical protein
MMVPFGMNGMKFIITSPYTPTGLVYEHYKMALDGDKSILMLKLPTWYVNPTVEMEFLAQEEKKDPTGFQSEYAAEFILTASPYITLDSMPLFEKCFEGTCSEIGTNYMGIDLGIINDSTGIAIASRDKDKINVIYAEELTPQGAEALDYTMIENLIVKLAYIYRVKSVRIDQYGGAQMQQSLNRRGVKKVEIPVASRENFDMYKYFEIKYRSGDIKMVEIRDDLIHQRFRGLTRKPAANSTYRVESSHDDLPDAIVRAVWEAGHDESYSPVKTVIDFEKANKAIERYQQRQQQIPHGWRRLGR